MQASILAGMERPGASGVEMAWAVRVVQLQNREKVPHVLRKAVGADEVRWRARALPRVVVGCAN